MLIRQLLRRIYMFSELQDMELERLQAMSIKRQYPRGQVVFHMGDRGGNLYIIRRGRVKVTIPFPNGEEAIIAILSDGDVLGELSFIDRKPHGATVTAVERTEVLCLQRELFLDFLQTRIEVALKILELLAHRLRDVNALVSEKHFLDVPSRLSRKILDLSKSFGIRENGGIRIGVRLTQKDLASMVGATRESVNKQLRILRQNEIIHLSNGYIRVLDPLRLFSRANAAI